MDAYVTVHRGELYMVNFGGGIGSEQSGYRPALIIQNNIGNKFSGTTIVCPLTSKQKTKIPTHAILLKKDVPGLLCNSTVLCEQLITIDKSRLSRKIGVVDPSIMHDIDEKIKISISIAS